MKDLVRVISPLTWLVCSSTCFHVAHSLNSRYTYETIVVLVRVMVKVPIITYKLNRCVNIELSFYFARY